MGLENAMAESGRWDAAIREISREIGAAYASGTAHPYPAERILRERLVPLLEASLDAIGKSPCGGQCPPDKCEYAKLLEVLESWLKI